MDPRQKAQLLISYLQSLPDFKMAERNQYEHMGAIIIDAMLQAGANYEAVRKRVNKVRKYEETKTTSGFLSLLNSQISVNSFLDWKGKKPGWVLDLAGFLRGENVETASDLQKWLQKSQNRERLSELPGFGRKTRDYLIKLAGLPSIAIDRHWLKALKCAGISYRDKEEAQRIVELAAGIWKKDKSALDTSVWQYFKKFKGDTCPSVIILRQLPEEPEREEWTRLSLRALDNAYGEQEPEYSLEALKERNPEYSA